MEYYHPIVQNEYRPPPRKNIRSVFLAFLFSTESRTGGYTSLLKKWISYFGGRINHVEPVFVFEDETAIAVSVTLRSQRVQFETRNITAYNTKFWECYPVNLTEYQKFAMWDFCANQNNKPFNTRGLYCNFFPLLYHCFGTRDDDDSAWFCSQLIVAALKSANLQEFLDCLPSRTSPEMLYQLLRTKNCFSSVMMYMGRIQDVELQL